MKNQCIQSSRFQVKAKTYAVLFTLLFSTVLAAQKMTDQKLNPTNGENDLINKYVQTKGNMIISFDASNIKQFWIDKSVIAEKDSFVISLTKNKTNSYKSKPLKIQLANVDASYECNVFVLTQTDNVNFSITDTNLNPVSFKNKMDSFIDYHELSSSFRLIEIKDNTFNFSFTSSVQDIEVKAIVLSFSQKNKYPSHPGYLVMNLDTVQTDAKLIPHDNQQSYSVNGTNPLLISKEKIYVTDNTVYSTITIKNTGDKQFNAFFGYEPYTEDEERIDNRAIPYKNENHIVKVLSTSETKDKLIVDSYPEWEEKCTLALNATPNLADFPNCSLLESTILKINKLEDNKAEIILNKPLKNDVPAGTALRVQSPYGYSRIWTTSKRLGPGESTILISKIKKDDTFLNFSSKAFCKGTHYVLPVIFLHSPENEVSSAEIDSCMVSF